MTQRLSDAIKRRAIAWAGQITTLAKNFAPNHLKAHIRSKVESKDGGTFIIRTFVDRSANNLEKYGTADARAQEYGSGLQARRGPKKKYPIYPKTKKVLAFHWDVADANPENFKFSSDGKVLLGSVQHPGIQAANGGKGYIGPAQNEIRKRGRSELSKDIRQAILGDLRVSFGRKG
jgi:hypothetical protein